MSRKPVQTARRVVLQVNGRQVRPRALCRVFRYRRPDEIRTNRAIAPLARSDILFSAVQIIREGGENTLHSHAGMDGFWFVLYTTSPPTRAEQPTIIEWLRREFLLDEEAAIPPLRVWRCRARL